MITSDTNFRGNFDSIEAVWEAIPYGGVEGDYLNIQGVKYRWNKYLAMWENAEVVTETPARETVTFDEDVNMQNNLTVAGVLRAKKFVVDDLPTGIEDVEITESAVSGGNNVITFTYTNGESQTFNIKNGEAGKTQAAFAVVADALDKTGWDTAKCYLVLTETEGEFDVYSYENEAWDKIDTIEIDLNFDVKQTTGDSTHAVMSQKAVTDELEVLGDNLINMSAMNADTSSTTYLSATKDVANNGVIFSVVRNNTRYPPHGRISPMKLVAGKKYRLSFEYLNTVVDSLLTFRNSDGGYIPCSTIEDKPALYNTDYAEYVNDFIAPEGAYYLAFMNLTNAAAGKSLTIRNFSCVEVLDIKDKINDIDNNIEQLNDDIDNINNIKADAIDIPYQTSQAVRTDTGHEGELVNRTGCGHSNYLPTKGAKKIYVLAPALGTSNAGIAFYCREAQTSCCGAVGFVHYTGVQESLWQMYDVPEGANFFRMTLYTDTPSQYKIVTPSDYLMELFKQSCQSMIGTQVMRSAVPISDKKYIYAFGAPQYPIIGHKAYVPYGANENTVDGDRIGYPNDSCMSIVDLFDLSHEVVYPIDGTKQKADGTPANNAVIGYATLCATPQGSIANFGLMRFNDNNPYYCYSIMDVASIPSLEPVDGKISPVKNWTTCRLSYNGNTVDFTINNYRQMLVDMGYASSYTASTRGAVDNINIHYDKAEGIYYAVLCGTQESQSMPLVLMQSTDLATWSPKSYLGVTTDANEIGAIYKDGVAYVTYRTASHGMGYLVYDVTNSTLLSSGRFPTSMEMLSKPDVFTFDNNVYMALNVDPSIYGELTNYQAYFVDARQEIAIYKVVNGVPKLFRRVNNPTGIDYFAFTETPPMYATESSANPMRAQGAIYLAFSEDRRHLYRRQIAQVSFADVTALFADNGRIG